MKRDEFIRQQYHLRRYMEHLNNSELEQRAKDVKLNMLLLTEETKIGLLPVNAEGQYWMTLWTHVLEEFSLRFGPYPAGFNNNFMHDLKVPDPHDPLAAKAAEVVKTHNLTAGSYLTKYGEYQFLYPALKNGAIRISPATSYDDSSLNHAIRDKELELYIQPHPKEVKLQVFDSKTNLPKGELKPLNNIITTKSQTNYYVYCLSSMFTPRLFLDFEADACLIILKPEEFIERSLVAFNKQFADWAGISKKVFYIDPLNVTLNDIDIFTCKHFRFAYQKEYRLIWLPPKPLMNLGFVDIGIGNLEESCFLISIN